MQISSWNLHIYDVMDQVASLLRGTTPCHYDTQCPLMAFWCTDQCQMAFWCCTHSPPTYWIYQYTITLRNTLPSHILTPPPKVWDKCKVTAIWLVNASKCPTHTTWHSRLRLRFTRIYLRFWARLTACLNNKINCLFQADQPCFVHNLTPFYWFSQIQKHLLPHQNSTKTSSILNTNWCVE